MQDLKHNFVIQRNVILRHGGPTHSASFPLLKEDRDARRHVETLQHEEEGETRQKKARWADQPQKMILRRLDGGQQQPNEVRPVLVDELCHVCAICEQITELDFLSKDGSKSYCSFRCKLKDERPQMLLGLRHQGKPTPISHMNK